MKNFLFIILMFVIFSCDTSKEKKGFSLSGEVKNMNNKYLYLRHGNTTDSVLVKNDKFQFNGEIQGESAKSTIFVPPLSSINSDFYLENKKMKIRLVVENRDFKNYKVNFIEIDTLIGSQTQNIYKGYQLFKEKYANTPGFQQSLERKLLNIVEDNPRNKVSGDVLAEAARDSLVTDKSLANLFSKLDTVDQTKSSIIKIKNQLKKQRKMEVGKDMIHFQLPNSQGDLVKTREFQGSLLLLDFWASWCIPCRKQFKDLSNYYNRYHDDGFNIISISVDKEKKRWKKALQEDQPSWTNVWQKDAFLGKVPAIYGVSRSIPRNFLINENDQIIAVDITMKDLQKLLDQRYN